MKMFLSWQHLFQMYVTFAIECWPFSLKGNFGKLPDVKVMTVIPWLTQGKWFVCLWYHWSLVKDPIVTNIRGTEMARKTSNSHNPKIINKLEIPTAQAGSETLKKPNFWSFFIFSFFSEFKKHMLAPDSDDDWIKIQWKHQSLENSTIKVI